MENKKNQRLVKSIKSEIKKIDKLEQMNEKGISQKDILKFTAEGLGLSQKVVKNIIDKNRKK